MEENTWKPIETAPMDGTKVLVCNENGGYYVETAFFGKFHKDSKEAIAWRNSLTHSIIYHPTHWMPMIAPPKKRILVTPHAPISGA